MSPRLFESRTPIVLVVDDVAANRELLEGHLDELGYDVRQARDGVEALDAIAAEEPDLVLLDIDMPRLDGITVCERIKAHPTRRLIPIVILTASSDRGTRLRGIAAGADDFLSKPFDAKELLVRARVLLRQRALNMRLDATEGVLFALARAVEARDRHTIHHAERVGRYAEAIGRAMDLDADDTAMLYDGGVLHDLGKIAIPDAILLKPGPLNDHEFATMRQHSVEGERICLTLRSVAHYLPIIRHHHERVDGQGYPDHLVGAQIPVGARMVAIGDAWDAMVSDRPYRAGLDQEEARRRLTTGSGTQWDAGMVHIFVALLDDGIVRRVTDSQLAATA
jgi:putative two-component system response regulator